jgi:hypothetical protein
MTQTPPRKETTPGVWEIMDVAIDSLPEVRDFLFKVIYPMYKEPIWMNSTMEKIGFLARHGRRGQDG